VNVGGEGDPVDATHRIESGEYRRAAEFRLALRRFIAHSDKAARRARLTPQRYVLMLAVKGMPRSDEQVTMTQLADWLELAPSTVTELVDRAEAAGLVQRLKGTDGRFVSVRLTEEGERRLDSAFLAIRRERDELLHQFEHTRRRFNDSTGGG
jgi:DNA-binding MarR family transcriptional regulator